MCRWSMKNKTSSSYMSSSYRGVEGRRRRRAVGVIVAIILVCLISGVVLWVPWRGNRESVVSAPKLPCELPRSELTLHDGRLFALSEDLPFHGVLYENFPGGKKKLEIEISGGKADGVSIGYFENGQREVEEHFTNGVSNGLRTRWDTDGKLVSKERIKDGKLHGMYVKWHPNGNKAVEMTLVHGKNEGVAQAWYPDGSLKSKTVFKNGDVLHRQSFMLAYVKGSAAYQKARAMMHINEGEAYEAMVKASRSNANIEKISLRSTPWIIQGKYFFPHISSLKILIGSSGFWERGVYVDGKSGKIDVADSTRKIKLKKNENTLSHP